MSPCKTISAAEMLSGLPSSLCAGRTKMSERKSSQAIVAALSLPVAPIAPADARRRRFLAHGAAVAGVAASAGLAPGANAQNLAGQPWERVYGAAFTGYGQPSRFELPVVRHLLRPYGDLAPGSGAALTPIESLEGIITPSSLHNDPQPQRHARHRSEAAPVAAARAGGAAADVLHGVAVALPHDHAHLLHRMLGQQHARPPAAARAAACGRDARQHFMQRVDGNSAARAARGGRSAARSKVAAGRGRRFGAHEPQHSAREGAR